MRKHLILLCIMAILLPLHTTAQSFKKEIYAKPELSANNYLAYPTPSGKLTPPPTGYIPVYISHYGRHGSRYLIHDYQYLRPLQILEKADSIGTNIMVKSSESSSLWYCFFAKVSMWFLIARMCKSKNRFCSSGVSDQVIFS